MADKGILYICPTPIGNLEDITLRTLRVLKEADVIAAEDTRRTIKLLNHYGIKTPITSYHEHNKEKKGEYLLGMLLKGKKIALVSDAGTPCISDPGFELITAFIEAGGEVLSLPGAVAAITALAASGMAADRFYFGGFPPKSAARRKEYIEELKAQPGTIILYVAPHRLVDVLKDCIDILGNRKAVIARELTKKYEEYIRSDLEGLLSWSSENEIKGEYVLLMQGVPGPREDSDRPWQHMSIREHLLWNMERGYSKKEAIKMTARERKVPKKIVYAESIEKK
jgi:16S rRNA (cytidine1402-2'-O)-methyltransferase